MQISKMQTTPAAESTRIPLRTSTEKREKSLSTEQLLDLEKSEQYRQELKEARENMLQACQRVRSGCCKFLKAHEGI